MKQTKIELKNFISTRHIRGLRLTRIMVWLFFAFLPSTGLAPSASGQENPYPPSSPPPQPMLPDENSIAAIEHGINVYQQFIDRSVVRVNLDANPVHLLPQNLQPAFSEWEQHWVQEHRLPPTASTSSGGSIIIMPEVQSTANPTTAPQLNDTQQQQLQAIESNPRRQLQLIRIFLQQNHAASQSNLWPVLRTVNQLLMSSQNGLPATTTGLVVSNQGRVLVLTSIGIPTNGSPVQLTTPGGMQISASVLGINSSLDMSVLQLPQNAKLPGIEPTSAMRNGPMFITIDPALGNFRFINPYSTHPRMHTTEMEFAGDLTRAPQFILNMHGELVAVTASNHSVIGAASWSDLVNFINTGKIEQRRFGVKYVSITPDSSLRRQYPQLGTQPAVLVQGVLPRSPAEFAGIHPNDIIVQIDGVSIAQLQTWLNRAHDNPQNVQIGILRDGKPLILSLDLTQKNKPANGGS